MKDIESKPYPLFVKSYEESVKIAQNELGKIQWKILFHP